LRRVAGEIQVVGRISAIATSLFRYDRPPYEIGMTMLILKRLVVERSVSAAAPQ
jgi:hypothetical protein